MASSTSQGKTSKKIMRPVVVGLQLLIVNMHVLQDETAKKTTTEGQENTSGKSFDWFQEDQFLGILRSLRLVLMNRINCPQPTSSKQNYQRQTKELKSIENVAVSYNFKKRPSIPGQHFVLQNSESQSIYCLCGEKVTKTRRNVNYKSYSIFHETLEVMVKKCVRIELESDQSDSVQKSVKEIKESKFKKDDATSSYFTEQSDCLQTSSVKRKKTTLRKMAKKSRIALIELPSYQKSKPQVVIVQENLDSQATSSRNRGCKPGPRSTKTTATAVIDLEKEPEGLKDVSKVEDLRDDQLKFLINQMEDYLRTIFRGEVYCRRHEDYKKGGKCRDDLNFQVGMAHFSEDQHECILSSLVAMFCYKDTKYLDYVTKVMLPEALIKLYQDIHKTSFEEAEECLFNDTIRDN
ncbi:Hypothetical predicted protein [Paramuricea clavata]|uniref:Uncharacterized protein n=1 Tax=Paramuricea clavata TaxID=317549 RepID=A0A6S7FXY8_PARCT|nr:Hypothetical predicted protein [Paramuricea clavata]